MRLKTIKFLLFTFLAISLVLAGCQPLGNSGIDLNQVLKNDSTIPNSFEANQSISLELNYDESLIDEDELAYYQLLDNSKLDIHMQKNGMNIWYEGFISVYKGDIPFKVSLTNDQMIIWVDNATKPIVFKGEEYDEIWQELIDAYGSYMLEATSDEIKATNLEIIDFFVRNLPNPNTISYDLNSSTTINSEQVKMTKIDSTVLASELPDLAVKFLNNIKADGALKDIMSTLYLYYGSVYMEGIEVTQAEADQYADDQYEMTVTMIDGLIEEIASLVDSGMADFNDNTYFKTTFYVDNSLRINKADNILSFEAPEFISSELGGLTGLKIESSYEIFNIDKDFAVNTIDISGKDYITVDDDDKVFFNSLNKQGPLFDILKNEVKVIPENTFILALNKKDVKITNYMDEDTNETMNVAPYSKNGTTLVPIRFISENMGSTVSWDKSTQKVTITKGDTTIILKVGSKVALVDGIELSLNAAPEIKDGSLMVPLRFISDAFDADVYWDGGTKTIKIEQFN